MAGGQLAHDGSFEGRTEFYKPYKMLPEAMNEIIAAMWIILTDRFLACVCVGVCVCVCVCIEGDARQGLPFSTQYVFAGLLLFFVCLFRYGNLFSLDTTCVCGSLVRLV